MSMRKVFFSHWREKPKRAQYHSQAGRHGKWFSLWVQSGLFHMCVEGEAQVCFVGLFCGVGRAHRVLVKHKLTGKWALLASGEPFGECRAMKRSTAPKERGREKKNKAVNWYRNLSFFIWSLFFYHGRLYQLTQKPDRKESFCKQLTHTIRKAN